MAQEARELICMITRGTDHELSSVGFTIANGGITAGMKVFIFLSSSGVDLDQLDDAQHCIGEALDAIEKTKERWCEAEAYRLAGGIALRAAQPDVGKAQAYFDRALAIARQ